jgi:hypothetical protein
MRIGMHRTIIFNIPTDKICLERYSKIQIMKSFSTPPKSHQKSEENMFARDNGESITSTLRCRPSNAIKHLIEQFADKFNLNFIKRKRL